MKNIIIIEVDSESQSPISISKGVDVPKPETFDEARNMVITDIKDLCNALCNLINVADMNKFAKADDMIDASIKSLVELKGLINNHGK